MRAPAWDDFAHALFQEDRVALGPRDEHCRERLEANVDPATRWPILGTFGQGLRRNLPVVCVRVATAC